MLSERQISLLKAIIDEYIENAEPVGSVGLVEKYRLDFSAATVRNEMAKLIEEGFLQMLHTSSGRVPTPMAYRLFLEELMEEEELPVLQEVALKQRLWPSRFEFEKMLRQAILALSDLTKELAVATSNDGFVVQAGAVNVLDNKEFWDIEAAKAVLYLLDHADLLEEIFQKAPFGGECRCVIGGEIGTEKLEECSIVFAPYSAGSKEGHIAVIGPARMRYQNIIPAVKYSKQLVEELGQSW